MPQNSETGHQGYKNGYRRADEIGTILGATRLSKKSNEFRWKNKRIVIKTGTSVVVTRAMISMVPETLVSINEPTE